MDEESFFSSHTSKVEALPYSVYCMRWCARAIEIVWRLQLSFDYCKHSDPVLEEGFSAFFCPKYMLVSLISFYYRYCHAKD